MKEILQSWTLRLLLLVLADIRHPKGKVFFDFAHSLQTNAIQMTWNES